MIPPRETLDEASDALDASRPERALDPASTALASLAPGDLGSIDVANYPRETGRIEAELRRLGLTAP